MAIKIKNRFTDEVIYTHDGDSLESADLCGADLCDADLCCADLCGADLRGANLHRADLCGADLRGANLYRADLRDASLGGADLGGANLYGADLGGADLRGADLSSAIKIPIYCRWTHGVTDGMVHIGCEKRSIDDWNKFFAGDGVLSTPRNTPEFKQIEAVFRAYEAYLNHLNK